MDYLQEVSEYNHRQQVGSHVQVIRDDDVSGRCYHKVETYKRLADLELKSGQVGRPSRFELTKVEILPQEERKKVILPVFDVRVVQEQDNIDPGHGRRCFMMEYFSMCECYFPADHTAGRGIFSLITMHTFRASFDVGELKNVKMAIANFNNLPSVSKIVEDKDQKLILRLREDAEEAKYLYVMQKKGRYENELKPKSIRNC